ETEEDYRRFDIERTALADVLTIDESGRVLAVSRAGSELVLVEPTAPPIEHEDGTKDSKERAKSEAEEDDALEEGVWESEPALEPPSPPAPSGPAPAPERVADTATPPSPRVESAESRESVAGEGGSPAAEPEASEETGPPP